MDDMVTAYIDGIPAPYRPLFDRLHRLILEVRPDADVVLSYNMPAYRSGARRLFLATWKHGVSVYGWSQDRDPGFLARHSALRTSKGTIQLTPQDAEAIGDDEFRDLFRVALQP